MLFQFQPTKYNSEWSNLLQLTIGGKKEQYGDRTPAIFFHEKGKMMVASAINGQKSCQPKNGTKYWNLPELGIWTEVVVGQQKQENAEDVHFYIAMGDVEIFRMLNKNPMNFSNVQVILCHSLCKKQGINNIAACFGQVYVASPWHPAQPCRVRAFSLETKTEG